jgi:anti-anti-sigma factor
MDRFTAATEEQGPNRFVVVLTGELDLAYTGRLQSILNDLILPGAHVVMDLSALTFLDSTGLKTLLQAAGHARAEGATFRLAAPHPAVVRIFNATGTAQALDIRDDVPAALAR